MHNDLYLLVKLPTRNRRELVYKAGHLAAALQG
jgi:hypothetical protein